MQTTADMKRSYIMSRIGSIDTSIEVLLRKALWHSGIRYRKNYSKLPGTPDIAITKYKIAIFCDGEFWHGKDWESKKTEIRSNRDYWISKIERNIGRDNEVNQRLCGSGWIVLRFWGKQILDDLTGCVNDINEVIFSSKVETYSSSRYSCDIYPCWLDSTYSENSSY
ncbi:MAG: very short patch repair endonuclease [Oscillospiraceae bacterium]|nr:very short patch repair endonuclease [Oscillospiraceae bacterium]